MKKMFILVVVLLAVPAMASTVTITCSVDNTARTVTVSYASDANLVRGFGLDLNVAAGGNVTAVTPLNANYRIYPGQIVIDGNDVTDYNTPYVPGSLGQTSVAVEMGSLYTLDVNYQSQNPDYGYNLKPATSGTLLRFTVNGTGNANGTVTENAARGGIVMENPNESPSVTGPLCTWNIVPPVTDCYPSSKPDYATWVTLGKPSCWCFPRQCHGDINGTTELSGKNTVAVGAADLSLFVAAWQSATDACSDLNHNTELSGKNTVRVGAADLAILVANWQGMPATDCNAP